jgi:hypothetical protein
MCGRVANLLASKFDTVYSILSAPYFPGHGLTSNIHGNISLTFRRLSSMRILVWWRDQRHHGWQFKSGKQLNNRFPCVKGVGRDAAETWITRPAAPAD